MAGRQAGNDHNIDDVNLLFELHKCNVIVYIDGFNLINSRMFEFDLGSGSRAQLEKM